MTQTSTRSSPHRANNFPWAPVLLVVAIAAALVMGRLMPLPWPGLQDAPAHWVGLGFGAIGLLLVVFATVTLLQHRTTILPDKAATTLVVSGPYRRFRNPIYLGEVLMLFAAAEVTKSIWFVAASLGFGLLVTIFQIIPEERHLEARFGDTYRDYKARTRRWI